MTRKNETLTIRVTEATRQAIQESCKRHSTTTYQITIADWLNEAIRMALESDKPKETKGE